MMIDIVGLVSLVFFGEKLIEILKPLFLPLINLVSRWLKLEDNSYVTAIFSAVVLGTIVFFSEANVLVRVIPALWFGRLVTILACVGGSGGLHDLLSLVRSKRAS